MWIKTKTLQRAGWCPSLSASSSNHCLTWDLFVPPSVGKLPYNQQWSYSWVCSWDSTASSWVQDFPVTPMAEQHRLHHTAQCQSSPSFPTPYPLPELFCLQENSLHSSGFVEKTEPTGTLNRSMQRTRPMPLVNAHSCITEFPEEKLRLPFSLICSPQSWHIYIVASSETGKNAFNEMESFIDLVLEASWYWFLSLSWQEKNRALCCMLTLHGSKWEKKYIFYKLSLNIFMHRCQSQWRRGGAPDTGADSPAA